MDKNVLRELEGATNEINIDKYKTALKKAQLINDLKQGLGEEIKKNPNLVTRIEESWYKKLGVFIKGIFTKF